LWWKLYLNHHVPFPFRQFAPSWTVCTNPPFSPTTTPCKVTSNLIPTLTDTTYRQWRQPLVTGTLEEEDLEVIRRLRLNYLNRFGDCAPPSQLPRFKERQLLEPSKNHLAGWFFRLQRKRLRVEKEDLKKILFRTTETIISSTTFFITLAEKK